MIITQDFANYIDSTMSSFYCWYWDTCSHGNVSFFCCNPFGCFSGVCVCVCVCVFYNFIIMSKCLILDFFTFAHLGIHCISYSVYLCFSLVLKNSHVWFFSSIMCPPFHSGTPVKHVLYLLIQYSFHIVHLFFLCHSFDDIFRFIFYFPIFLFSIWSQYLSF